MPSPDSGGSADDQGHHSQHQVVGEPRDRTRSTDDGDDRLQILVLYALPSLSYPQMHPVPSEHSSQQ